MEEEDDVCEETEEITDDGAAYDSDYAYESDGGLNDEEEMQANLKNDMEIEEFGNSFNVHMDPNEQTTEEWRAIFAQLRTLVVKSDRKINFEWEARSPENFRVAIIYVESLKERSCFYPFRINFHATQELCFPEVPPQIQPLFPLPARPFVMIYKHPLLTTKHWNPCQDISIIIEFIVSTLDNQLEHLESILLDVPVAGGNLNSFIRSAAEAMKWLNEPIDQLALEHLISFLYGYYMFEIPYHPDILDQFVRGERLLTACPINLKKELPKYSGIGYSRDTHYGSGRKDTANTAQQSQSAVGRVMEVIKAKFDYFLSLLDPQHSTEFESSSTSIRPAIKFHNEFTPTIAKRLALWIAESPLLYIIHRKIEQLASGDMVRESSDSMILFDILLQIELICSKTDIPRDSNAETLFLECYKKLYSWVKRDIFSEEPQIRWLKTTQQLSEYWKTIESNEAFYFDQNSFSSPMKSEFPNKMARLDKNQVIYVPGLERHNFYYSSSSSGSIQKCNRFFLKELKTLNESLPEEIVVFVSEEHPNYLMALFSIRNEDSPYYGGMFLFHIMIPDTYPNVPPSVQFMTTGYGTVRFNPNLYNNGKVCLSLLGTWSGEPWDPKASNLNQVLSSILFLIFTEEPFYNEPGFDRDGRKHVKESQNYDGAVIGNVISFAILDHLIKPSAITEIYQQIRSYFQTNWERISEVLNKKLEFHRTEETLHRPWETIQSELANITTQLQRSV